MPPWPTPPRPSSNFTQELAGAARVTEMKTRIKVALPSGYPHQQSWALLAGRAVKLPP